MQTEDLKESIQEAERFLKRAKLTLKESEEERARQKKAGTFYEYQERYVLGSLSNTAAVKRASLDLSKAMVKLR